MCDSGASVQQKTDTGIKSNITIRHDWYQTEKQVFLLILVKNCEPDSVKISYSKTEVNVALKLEVCPTFNQTWHLSHEINPDQCSHKVLPSKIEIKLSKADGQLWSTLEMVQRPMKKVSGRNWDKLVSEIEDDPQEGEDALNALFQRIYSEGSDEVKKAMTKSFLESGGTELNTNWEAVKKERVSIKPPDGMEWKSWDQ